MYLVGIISIFPDFLMLLDYGILEKQVKRLSLFFYDTHAI